MISILSPAGASVRSPVPALETAPARAPAGPAWPAGPPGLPEPPLPAPDDDRLAAAVRGLLDGLGLDRSDPHLADTDRRVARAWRELFAGHFTKSAPALRTFPNEAGFRDALTVVDIPLYSVCAHHLLPFFGRAHIAYLPGDRLLGLSKFTRLVDWLARRPQVQERLTAQIADHLEEALQCRGLLVVVEARHLCVEMRGVRGGASRTTTVAGRGALAAGAERSEVLRLLTRDAVSTDRAA